MIVDYGPVRARLMSQAKRLGVSKRVLFIGSTGSPENYLQVGDIPVLRSETGALGQVLPGARASGLKVAAFGPYLPYGHRQPTKLFHLSGFSRRSKRT